LPEFLNSYIPQARLIVHNTLAKRDSSFTTGSVLVFDQSGSARDEFRAMMAHLAAFLTKAKPVALARDEQVAFVFE
jgi:hypothetical protein